MSSKASAIRATIQIKRYSSQTPSFHKCLNFLSAPILLLEARETLLQCGHRIVGELNCTSLASCEHHTNFRWFSSCQQCRGTHRSCPCISAGIWVPVCTRAGLRAVFTPEALLMLASIRHTPLMTYF